MLAELLNSASLAEQFVESSTNVNHKSGFSFLDDENKFYESIENIGRQLTDVSGLDCYTLNSSGLQYKLGDLVCDDQQIWVCINEHQCKSF